VLLNKLFQQITPVTDPESMFCNAYMTVNQAITWILTAEIPNINVCIGLLAGSEVLRLKSTVFLVATPYS
jgi:hypothetical protein